MLTTIKNVKEIVRSLKVSFVLAFPGIIVAIILSVLAFMFHGFVFSCFWNVAIPAMFGFRTLTTFSAMILCLALGSIRTNYISTMSFLHTKIKNSLCTKFKEKEIWDVDFENTVNAFSLISSILLTVVSIIVYVILIMYSWNIILPGQLGMELYHINFVQTFAFAAVANYLFSKSSKLSTEIMNSVDIQVTEVDKQNDIDI